MKLQPNFSWQAYQGINGTEKEQFQFQLQAEHIQVANSVNATIDDESYFTKPRMTSFTWIDSKPIWKKTITGLIVGTATTLYPTGITNIGTVVRLEGQAQDTVPLTTVSIPLPHVAPVTLANSVGVSINGSNLQIITNSGVFNGYTFYVTIYYTLK